MRIIELILTYHLEFTGDFSTNRINLEDAKTREFVSAILPAEHGSVDLVLTDRARQKGNLRLYPSVIKNVTWQPDPPKPSAPGDLQQALMNQDMDKNNLGMKPAYRESMRAMASQAAASQASQFAANRQEMQNAAANASQLAKEQAGTGAAAAIPEKKAKKK